jgi:hypothetical protein
MTKLTIEDRLDLAELALRGFWLIDQGRAGEAAALFAEDANLTFGPGAPRPGTISGAAIAAAMGGLMPNLNPALSAPLDMFRTERTELYILATSKEAAARQEAVIAEQPRRTSSCSTYSNRYKRVTKH